MLFAGTGRGEGGVRCLNTDQFLAGVSKDAIPATLAHGAKQPALDPLKNKCKDLAAHLRVFVPEQAWSALGVERKARTAPRALSRIGEQHL